ncbi:MAG: hypothetical protein A4E35_02325 [Methanoregula sp. PtaU1.Bin051]|nr:MAG: hypothetical protein A4E35_02325 [Methanoregula sp. PtaU1.Bin051]
MRIFNWGKQSKCDPFFITGLLCTALTLPYLWFVLPPFVDAAYYLLIGEGLLIIVEVILLRPLLEMGLKESAVCSLIMNTVSFWLGWFLL